MYYGMYHFENITVGALAPLNLGVKYFFFHSFFLPVASSSCTRNYFSLFNFILYITLVSSFALFIFFYY